MAVEPASGTVVSSAVAKAIDGLAGSLTKQIGRFAKPIVDRAVVDLGVGFRSYLDASYNRCRFFKTILNQAQPLEVVSHYVHNTLTCGNRTISDDDLIAKLSEWKYVVVTGLAGSGKSMFMKYLTICKFERPAGSIPLFVELRHLNSISKKDLLTFIQAQCTAQGHAVTIDQFNLALAAGAFCLILDGFDELNHEFRDGISKQILDIVKKYPEVPIVVSSRHDDRFGGWTPFHVYNVETLTKAQCLTLIGTLEYDNGVKRRFAREVKERLYDSHTSFLSSPLLTTIMLLTYEEFAEIPVKMHSFYSQAFDTLFQKHDASKEQYQRKTQTTLGKDDFKITFAAFCAMSYLNQRFSFEEDDLNETAESAVKYVRQARAGLPKPLTAKTLLADLKEAVCLLQQDGLETAFVHRSFQEYFAAVFATTLHGEKLKRVLDKYSLRFGDSVVYMTRDMAEDAVDNEWVIPVTEMLEARIFQEQTSIKDRVSAFFPHLSMHGVDNDVFVSFRGVDFEILGPLEILSNIFPEQLGSKHLAGTFRYGLRERLRELLSKENEDKPGYEYFLRVAEQQASKQRRRLVEIDWNLDHDWWLEEIGIKAVFERYQKGLPAIRKSIANRAKRQNIILEEFL